MITRRSAMKLAAASGLAAIAGPKLAAARTAPQSDDVLVVVEKSGHSVSFYDVGSGSRLKTVALPEYPHEMVVDSRGRFAYVGHFGVRMSAVVGEGGAAVFVIDLVTRELVRTIDIRPFNRIHGMGIDRRDRVYALSEEKATLLGFDDPATATAPTRAVHTGGIKTHLFSLTGDGERAYVTALLSHTVSLVRPHDATAPPVLMTPGLRPEGSSLSVDERTLFVGARSDSSVVAVDARTMRVKKTVEIGGDPLRVYTIDDDRILVANYADNTIRVLRTDLRPLWTLKLDGQPAAASLHPSKPIAYVSQYGADSRIAIVDLERRAVVGSFVTQLEPDVSVLLPGAQ